MALAAANTHLLTINTATAGLRTGTVGTTATSPQAMAPTFSGTYSLGVLDHAIGSFASATTSTTLDIDFGTLTLGAAPATRSFDIFNRTGTLGSVWTAKLDLDGITSSGTTGVFSTTLAPFANLVSGSFRSFSAAFATGTTGSFTTTYTLNASDENLLGATTQSLTLNLRGIVQAADTIRTVAAGQVVQDSAAITGAGQLIKQGAGELVRSGSSSYIGGTVVQAGLLTVTSSAALGSGPLTVATSAALSLQTTNLAVTALNVADAGKIDLGTGRITVAPGGVTAADLRADILAGLGSGSWNGTSGITSGSAAAIAGRSVGYTTTADGSLVAAFAAPGDTDLSGTVDLSDLISILAAGAYGTGMTASWSEGDFNYDGVADLGDLIDILAGNAYGQGSYLPGPSRALLRAFTPLQPLDLLPGNEGSLAGMVSPGEAPFVVAVPEPSGCLIAVQAAIVATLACLRRRRI